MDDNLFDSESQSAIPRGSGNEAVDAIPSELSGANAPATIAQPVWRQFVANEDFQRANAGAIEAEHATQRRAEVGNRMETRAAAQPVVWGGENGRLLRRHGRTVQEFDPAALADHPEAGPAARRTMWDAEKKKSYNSHALAQDLLANPDLKTPVMKAKDYEDAKWQLENIKGDDPLVAGLKPKMDAEDARRAKVADLQKTAWQAKMRHDELLLTHPDDWWRQEKIRRTNANRQQIVAGAVAQGQQADGAAQSLAADQSALAEKLQFGVKAADLPAVNAQQAEHARAAEVISGAKQGADQQLEGVKQAARAENAPESAPTPPPEGIMATIIRTLATELPSSAGVVAGSLAGAGIAGAAGVETGPGLIATGVAGGIAGGAAVRKIQNTLVGPDATKQNELQRQANALANPWSAQFADMAAMLVAFATPGGAGGGVTKAGWATAKTAAGEIIGKAATKAGADALRVAAAGGKVPYAAKLLEHIAQGSSGFAKVEGAGAVERGDSPLQVADAMAKGAVEGGAMGLIPGARVLGKMGLFKTAQHVLMQATGRGIADSVALTFAGDLYDSAVHGKEINYDTLSKQLKGNTTAFVLQNLVLGALHVRGSARTPEDFTRMVNDHLAGEDPKHEPTTLEEINKAHSEFAGLGSADLSDPANYHPGAAGQVGDNVLLLRELASIHETNQKAVDDAQAAVDANPIDKDAPKILDAARQKAQQVPLVRAVMKIAAGAHPDDLPSDELAAVGLRRVDGAIKGMEPRELNPMGLKDPLISQGDDKTSIITAEAIRRVRAISARAASRLSKPGEEQTYETEQIAAATARKASSDTPDGTRGDPAAGASGGAPHGTKGAEENQTDVSRGTIANDVPDKSSEAPAADTTGANPIPGQAGTPAAADPVAVREAKQHLVSIAKKNTRLRKLIRISKTGRAEAKPDGTIHINPEALLGEATALGMKPKDSMEYFKRVVDEEIRHAAHFDALRKIWKDAGSVGEEPEWRKHYCADLWEREFKGTEKENIVRNIYAQDATDATKLAEFDKLDPEQKLMEAIRIMSQERAGAVTEGAKLWGNIGHDLYKLITETLAALRDMVKGGGVSPEIEKQINGLEESLNKLHESTDEGPADQGGNNTGNPPESPEGPSVQAPAPKGPEPKPVSGAAALPKDDKSEGVRPVDSQDLQDHQRGLRERTGARAGFSVGDKVSFKTSQGIEGTGKITLVASNGMVKVVSDVGGIPYTLKPEMVKAVETKQPTGDGVVDTIAGRMNLDEFEKKGYSPDQVTRQNWIDLQRANRRKLGQSEDGDTKNAPNAEYEEYHKQVVKESLARGETVDPEVLADYPDLQKKPEPKPAAAPPPAEAPAETNRATLEGSVKFTSRKEAVAWMKENGLTNASLTKLDSELFSLDVPKGDYKLPRHWYKMNDKWRFTTPADPDNGFGLQGPFTRQYVADTEGIDSRELAKREKAVALPKPPAAPVEPKGEGGSPETAESGMAWKVIHGDNATTQFQQKANADRFAKLVSNGGGKVEGSSYGKAIKYGRFHDDIAIPESPTGDPALDAHIEAIKASKGNRSVKNRLSKADYEGEHLKDHNETPAEYLRRIICG
jgi:hypothetical protein